MPNDSSTGGYILPTGDYPPYDAALDAIFQAMIVGITGLPGNMVRPRWQAVAPKQPEPTVDWCAIGVTVISPDAGPAIIHDGTGDGHDLMQRHEEIEVLCSFYGHNAGRYMAMARDGIALPLNNGMLETGGISFVGIGRHVIAPELVNQQWIRRWDLPMTFRRNAERTYPILNLESAEVSVITDSGPSIDAQS